MRVRVATLKLHVNEIGLVGLEVNDCWYATINIDVREFSDFLRPFLLRRIILSNRIEEGDL